MQRVLSIDRAYFENVKNSKKYGKGFAAKDSFGEDIVSDSYDRNRQIPQSVYRGVGSVG